MQQFRSHISRLISSPNKPYTNTLQNNKAPLFFSSHKINWLQNVLKYICHMAKVLFQPCKTGQSDFFLTEVEETK